MFRRPEFSHKSAPPKHPTVREKWKCREGCEAKPFLRPPGKSVGNVRKFPDVVFRDGFLPFFSIRRLDSPVGSAILFGKAIYISILKESRPCLKI